MTTVLTILHIFASIFLILVVLLQSGRGGGMGAAFGGASTQIFGGRGAGNFLSRVTTGLAIVFMVTSLSLSMFSSQKRSVVKDSQDTEETTDTGMSAEDEEAEAEATDEASSSPEAETTEAASDDTGSEAAEAAPAEEPAPETAEPAAEPATEPAAEPATEPAPATGDEAPNP